MSRLAGRPRLPRGARRLRHHQPQFQLGPDRLGRRYLDRLGVKHERIDDETGKKSNLWATIGPAGRPGYILSGHTDVVPVDDQNWTERPVQAHRARRQALRPRLDRHEGYLRAASRRCRTWSTADLKKPMHLAFSYDEEVGCSGVRRMIAEDLGGAGASPTACFVGEPTEMDVVIGHKGKRSFKVDVRGRTCHSSLAPQGVNAVEYAARVDREDPRHRRPAGERGARATRSTTCRSPPAIPAICTAAPRSTSCRTSRPSSSSSACSRPTSPTRWRRR